MADPVFGSNVFNIDILSNAITIDVPQNSLEVSVQSLGLSGGDMYKSNNLSDLVDITLARFYLGLGNYANGSIALGNNIIGGTTVGATTDYVGVGTKTPAARLHILGAGQNTGDYDTTALGGALLLSDTSTAAGAGGAVVFSAASGSWRYAAIQGLVVSGASNSTGSLSISVRKLATDTTLTEAVRVIPSGFVGIGTSAPSQLLHVRKDQNATTMLLVQNGTVGASATTVFQLSGGTANEFFRLALNNMNGAPNGHIQWGSAVTAVFIDTNAHIFRNAAGSEYGRFNSLGKLGVGTTTPSTKLQVVGGITTDRITLGDGSAANYGPAYQAIYAAGNYTGGAGAPYGLLSITDTASNTGGNFLTPLWIAHNINAGAGAGNRSSFLPILTKNVAIAGTDTSKKFYTPFFSQFYINAGDGGTSSSVTYGDHYGGGSLVQAQAGATFLHAVQGWEMDVSIQAGASAKYKTGLLIASVNSDAVNAFTWEAMLAFARDASTTAQWAKGIDFFYPLGLWAFSTTATLIGSSAAATTGIGIDFSLLTFNTAAIKTPGFTLDGAGNITQVKSVVGCGQIAVHITALNINAVGDTTVAINLPADAARYQLSRVSASNSTGALPSTATLGVFTAAAGGGAALLPATALSGLTSQAANTANNCVTLTPSNAIAATATTLYIRVAVAQGATATVDVIVVLNLL